MLKKYTYKMFLAAIVLFILASPAKAAAGTDQVEIAPQGTGEIMLAHPGVQNTAQVEVSANSSTSEIISRSKGTDETFLEMLSDTMSSQIFPNAGSLETLIKGADPKKGQKGGKRDRRRRSRTGKTEGKPVKTTAEIEAEKYYEYPQLVLESSTFEALVKKLAGTVETVLPKTKKAVEKINSEWDKRWSDLNAPKTEEIEAMRAKVAAATLEAELKRKRRERRMQVTEEVKIEPGADIFMRYCDGCHSDYGKTFYSDPLKGRSFWAKYSAEGSLGKVIREGVRGERGDMPRYGRDRISDKELEALVEHMRSLIQPIDIGKKEDQKKETKETEIAKRKEETKEIELKKETDGETQEVKAKDGSGKTQEPRGEKAE